MYVGFRVNPYLLMISYSETGLGALLACKHLDLHSNGLTLLPLSLGNMAALKWLDLSCNALKNLPPSVGELSCLEQLRINSNEFQVRTTH